jgi:hypothetical protein
MGGTLRVPDFKILSMRYIELAQKTAGAKICAKINVSGHVLLV